MTATAKMPAALIQCNQWVAWRSEPRPGEDKPTKIPYSPRTHSRASSTDRATWGTYADALRATREGKYDGIGFVFSGDDPFVGIDLDKCRDAATGQIEPWARAIIEQFDSYTEISPSGTGIHILIRGKLPDGGNRKGQIEIYEKGRYFTMTGDHLPGTPETIEVRADVLKAWHAEVFAPDRVQSNGKHTPRPAAPLGLDDSALIEKAKSAANGGKFSSLWNGDWQGHFQSQSEADLSFCTSLAFWTGGDSAGVDRLFRQSALFREKWDARHFGNGKTYGQATIEKAIAGCTEFYTPGKTLARPEPAPDAPAAPDDSISFGHNDVGNKDRLVAKYGDVMRFCHPWNTWMIFNGIRWERDESGKALKMAEDVARGIIHEAQGCTDDDRRSSVLKHAGRSLAAARIREMLNLAQSHLPILPGDFDRDQYLLNVENGTLDLRTGELRPHDSADYITRLAPVKFDPTAMCDTFFRFLDRIFDRSQDLSDFCQRAAGYGMTGDVSEQCLFFLYGTGANGKSTFLNVIQDVLGDYSLQARSETLLAKHKDGVPHDIAELAGARFVATIEADDGKRLAESLVKSLTGGDRIRARFLFEKSFEFRPVLKIFLAANHKPVIRGTDHAIWRRIKMIPFTVSIPENERDGHLPEKLKAEASGILNWLLRGCLEWQEYGLATPDVVTDATTDYREEMDVLAPFLTERCRVENHGWVTFKDLFKNYLLWCEANGDQYPLGRNKFASQLEQRGFIRKRATDNILIVQGLTFEL